MIELLTRALGPAAAAPVRRHTWSIVLYCIAQGVCFVLLVPVLRALFSGDTATAWRWVVVLAVVVAVTCALRWWQAMAGYSVGMEVSRALHRRIGDHVAALPLGWFDAGRSGGLAQLTTKGVQDVMGVPAHLLTPILAAVVTPATVLIGIAIIDWPLAVAAVAPVPLLIVVERAVRARVGRGDQGVHEAGTEAADRLIELARAQQVLRAYAGSGRWGPLDDSLDHQYRATRRLLLGAAPALGAFVAAVQVAFVVVLAATVFRALDGAIDAATALALLVLAVRFTEPLVAAADLGGAVRIARNSLVRVNELLETPTLPEPDASAPVGGPSIELSDVTFGYDPVTPVLREVSLRVEPGTTVALVGASGSGKTTLTRLVARFYDVQTGTVTVAGADVRHLRTEDLMAQLSLVFQDVYLFEGTIAENIRVGRPDADDAAVRAAAVAARVDEIVDRLPDGWDTRVGEGGARLSGGERQRVSIARALLKDAPIVLLDEATAALDPENEAAVAAGLSELTRGRTVLVIAHRLTTVASADRIVVLDEGRIVEQGRHEDLLARGGRYAAFWDARSRAVGWRLERTGVDASKPGQRRPANDEQPEVVA